MNWPKVGWETVAHFRKLSNWTISCPAYWLLGQFDGYEQVYEKKMVLRSKNFWVLIGHESMVKFLMDSSTIS